MDIDINKLSIREKIAQMFILGFSGIDANNQNIISAINSGLGGVIFFAENIKSDEQFKGLIKQLQSQSKIPLFTSIDQEGGLVERTIFLKNRLEFLTPMALTATESLKDIENHTQILSDYLKYFGINMNFAPVLDVNTNPVNPVIGVRAFSNNTDEVIKYSEPVYRNLQKNKIIAVGKHFPGHGEAWVDSHLDLPEINLDFEELNNIHIRPFEHAINNGLDAIMVAHVYYQAFNDDRLPASLSKQVITDFLKNKLGFKGLIISDDMVMGGVANHFDKLDACIKAINAGIDVFIYRDANFSEILDKLTNAAEKGLISENRIDDALNKILHYKEKYGILNDIQAEIMNIDFSGSQEQIDNIADKTINIFKRGEMLPLNKVDEYIILSPDKSKIFNYSQDQGKLSDFLELPDCKEMVYSINPDNTEIKEILKQLRPENKVIFISYNALINKGQIELFNSIKNPKVAVVSGIPYDAEKFSEADSIVLTFGYRTLSLRVLAGNLL